MLSGKQAAGADMDSSTWYDFIKALRAEQDKLRAELEPYENGTLLIGKGRPGSPLGDCTDETIATIKGEIASLQRTIDRVISEQGLHGA
jgi:hypothetical protein